MMDDSMAPDVYCNMTYFYDIAINQRKMVSIVRQYTQGAFSIISTKNEHRSAMFCSEMTSKDNVDLC